MRGGAFPWDDIARSNPLLFSFFRRPAHAAARAFHQFFNVGLGPVFQRFLGFHRFRISQKLFYAGFTPEGSLDLGVRPNQHLRWRSRGQGDIDIGVLLGAHHVGVQSSAHAATSSSYWLTWQTFQISTSRSIVTATPRLQTAWTCCWQSVARSALLASNSFTISRYTGWVGASSNSSVLGAASSPVVSVHISSSLLFVFHAVFFTRNRFPLPEV